jgi:AhpD family alkylhydroperoxidase
MTIVDSQVSIPRRLDFDAHLPSYSAAVSALDSASSAEYDRLELDPRLRELIKLRASQLNGCAYCVDLHSRDARAAGESEQRLHAVAVWPESEFFNPAERAAFALTEAVTRLSETHVPDAVVTDALNNFSEEEVSALVSVIVTINVWNAIGVTARCWSPRLRG